jgi:hypothetical protein
MPRRQVNSWRLGHALYYAQWSLSGHHAHSVVPQCAHWAPEVPLRVEPHCQHLADSDGSRSRYLRGALALPSPRSTRPLRRSLAGSAYYRVRPHRRQFVLESTSWHRSSYRLTGAGNPTRKRHTTHWQLRVTRRHLSSRLLRRGDSDSRST